CRHSRRTHPRSGGAARAWRRRDPLAPHPTDRAACTGRTFGRACRTGLRAAGPRVGRTCLRVLVGMAVVAVGGGHGRRGVGLLPWGRAGAARRPAHASAADASGGRMSSASSGMDFLYFASGVMCFDPQRVGSPSQKLFEPDNPSLGAVPVQVGGRQSAWFVSGGFGPAVLRHYRRGGLVARLSHDHYLWTGVSATRPFAEFRILQFLHGKGLPVPAPLAGAYWRSGPFYRAAILIER